MRFLLLRPMAFGFAAVLILFFVAVGVSRWGNRPIAALEQKRVRVFTRSSCPVWLRKWIGNTAADLFPQRASELRSIHTNPVKGQPPIMADVSDEEMVHVGKLRHLETVDFTGMHVTDEGLRHLQGMEKLWSVNLNDTHVSNRGLKYLESLPMLTQVFLARTAVTESGIESLKRAHPKLVVYRR